MKSKTLQNKIKTLKAKKKVPKYNSDLNTLIVKDVQVILSSLKVINKEKADKLFSKSYTKITVANAAQNLLEKT